MARPPSGPIGNSPRDVRDDAVGVPADPIKAPEPPRWPPKRKKITSNTFHAKVSGGTSPSRADRAPHYRRGGMVSGYANGGVIAKRDELPGEQKNDPFAKENVKQTLKSGGSLKKKYADGGEIKEPRGGFKPPDKPISGGPLLPPKTQIRGPNIPRTDVDREQIWGLQRKKGGKT